MPADCLAVGEQEVTEALVLAWTGNLSGAEEAPVFLNLSAIPDPLARIEATALVRPDVVKGSCYLAPKVDTYRHGALVITEQHGPCILAEDREMGMRILAYVSLETGRKVSGGARVTAYESWELVFGDPHRPDLVVRFPDDG